MDGEDRPLAPVKISAHWRIVLLCAGAIVAFFAVLYYERTFVVARLAEIYLKGKGVPASIEVSRIDWSGIDARVRLGARRTPDLSIENVHAVFNGAWIPDVTSIILSHSVLRVAFDGEKLSFGTLQHLVDSFTQPAPQRPVLAAPGPQTPLRIVLRDAKVLAFTPAGALSFAGSGALSGGKIVRFYGNIGRANLRTGGFALLLSGGSFIARNGADGLNLHADANGRGFVFDYIRTAEAQASFDLRGLVWTAQGGGTHVHFASGHGEARAQSINGRTFSVVGADAQIALGAWQGDLTANGPRGSGPFDVVLDLAQLRTAKADAGRASVQVHSTNLRIEDDVTGWHVSGPVSQSMSVTAGRYRLGTATLSIAKLGTQAKGEVRAGGDGVTGTLTTSVQADLAAAPRDARKFAHEIPLLGDDPNNVQAVVAALRGVRLDAANIYIGKSAAPLVVTLPRPVTLMSRSGARAKLTGSGEVALSVGRDGRMAGGFAAALSGGGLPSLNLDVSQFAAREKSDGLVLTSALSLSAKASLKPFRGLSVATNGKLQMAHGHYRFTPDGCAKIGLGAYGSGPQPTLGKMQTQLCALARTPLLTSSGDGWKLQGTWRNLTANFESAQAHAASHAGRLDIAGNSDGLADGFVEATNVRLTDTEPAPRFVPLLASARLTLADSRWRGTIALAIAKTKRKLASVTVRHDMDSGSGEAAIASDMVLSPDGFQPGEVSPVLASITQASGRVKFQGRIAWTADGQTSGGTLTVDKADFIGPIGTVKGAHTAMVFTSLAPLTTASAQSFTAKKIDWLVPFADLVLKFRLTAQDLKIESLTAAAAGGHVALAPMAVVFDPKATLLGTLKFDHFNLGALVAASNLSDKVSLNTQVTGEIPFRYGPAGLRTTDGHFASTGPSRLSINRTVWTGGEPQISTDAIRDFAYQALENLAIDELDAKLNSLPEGRLGVIFHIKGRNDPAEAKETRIPILALLQGDAFDKPLPLPKGTPVDLTLDTSLNFDELLAAYRRAFSADLADAASTSQQDEGTTP